MMQKRAELDTIGFDVGTDPVRQGVIELRWRLMSWDDRKQAWNKDDYLRAVIDADADIALTFKSIQEYVIGLGYDAPPDEDGDYIKMNADRAWTPRVRAAVAADRAEKKRLEEEGRATREAEEQEAKAKRKTEEEAAEKAFAERVEKAAKSMLKAAGLDLDAPKGNQKA